MQSATSASDGGVPLGSRWPSVTSANSSHFSRYDLYFSLQVMYPSRVPITKRDTAADGASALAAGAVGAGAAEAGAAGAGIGCAVEVCAEAGNATDSAAHSIQPLEFI